MLGNYSEPWIGKNFSQLLKELWTGKKRKSAGSASTQYAGRLPFPAYSRHHDVGVQNDLQERRALRTASPTTSGLTRALATAE